MKPTQRPRILLVDDDDLLRRSFVRVLAATYEVTQASDGREAIEVLQRATFDAVVTDLEMPNLGGDGLVAWLLENQPEVARRVIVLTGGARRASSADWLRAFDPGRVLRKPCSAVALSAAIDGVVQGGDS